jgi:DNA invertase Pin-like site-specific DNA recombinase
VTISILAAIAEFERELIQARMAEGRRRAVKNGVKFGRRNTALTSIVCRKSKPNRCRHREV